MTTPKRSGRWESGQSGNPAGRTPGSGEVAKLRAAIAEHVPAIITRLVESARAGDVAAARLLLERVVPALKPTEAATPVALEGKTLSAQGRSAIAALAAGTIGPAEAAALRGALGALAKLTEAERWDPLAGLGDDR